MGPLEYVINTPHHHRMHHRPPGNCNYAGTLIIWDRLFGTFTAETERKDYYGLAAPVETFEPIELNAQHWRKIAKLKFVSPSLLPKVLRRLFSVRARHSWICSPLALFESLDAMKDGKSSWLPPEGPPYRQKYDGARLSVGTKISTVLLFMTGFAMMKQAGKQQRDELFNLALSVSAGVLSLHFMGNLLDSGSIFKTPDSTFGSSDE